MADFCAIQAGGSFQLEIDLRRFRKSYSNHFGYKYLKKYAVSSSGIAFAGDLNLT
jgi:hypothetical protein